MKNQQQLAILILTYNEEIHLNRCLNCVQLISKNIYILDSFSTDNTKEIALKFNCHFLQRKFKYQAEQLNWFLNNIKINEDWLLRIDADEYLSGNSVSKLNYLLQNETLHNLSGVYFRRTFNFQNKILKFGGVQTNTLRLIRLKDTKLDNRLMDEKFIVNGKTINTDILIIDHNLKGIEDWLLKHIKYAKREALQWKVDQKSKLDNISFKYKIYYLFNPELRVLLYFFYRYFIRLGFLDGEAGLYFNLFQALLYRSLIEVMIKEHPK